MTYPKEPGIYWFLDKNDKVIYVGKAKNLNNRLKSYTLINQTAAKTRLMLKQTKKIKYKVVDSELKALILEAELIKTYQPKYNVLLKDDKSRLYLTFTREAYPRILFTRKTGDFGPFPSTRQTRLLLRTLRRIFPYCDQPGTGRPCFYYHLKLCPGACCGKIRPREYRLRLQHLKLFLKGRHQRLIKDINVSLQKAVKNKDFESAALFRDQIQALTAPAPPTVQTDLNLPFLTEDKISGQIISLRRLLKRYFSLPPQYPLHRLEAYDISNLSGQYPTGAMVVFLDGRKSGSAYRCFKIKSPAASDDLTRLAEVIQRRVNHPEWGIPNLILVDGGKNQVKTAAKIIPWDIPVIGLIKRPDRLCLQGETLKVNPTDPGQQLLQVLRDEAHRFARKLHFKLRSRSMSLA